MWFWGGDDTGHCNSLGSTDRRCSDRGLGSGKPVGEVKAVRWLYKFIWPSEADLYPSNRSMLAGVSIVAMIVTIIALYGSC